MGLPGLRWYDRARARCRFPDFTRSYLGAELRHIDGDLTGEAPTMFELAAAKLGSMTMIGRGLARPERLGYGLRFALRAARTHWRGDVRGWLRIDREMGRDVARHIRAHRPDFAFAAFMGVDKTSHQMGHESPAVLDGLPIVDETAAGWRVIGHPWVYGTWDVALMVSGNAMAHLYVSASAGGAHGGPSSPRAVPLLTNQPPVRAPRRTTDVMPAALAALGLAVPTGVEGEPFE